MDQTVKKLRMVSIALAAYQSVVILILLDLLSDRIPSSLIWHGTSTSSALHLVKSTVKMSFVLPMFTDPSISPADRQDALNRAFSDPGIPDPKHTTSPFWLRDPHPQLSGCQSSILPTEADVVIIGSGVTGASIVRTLLEDRSSNDLKSEYPAVVMLEARDVCSGATGRNGGHILETADEFAGFMEEFGLESAKKLLGFRLAHLGEMLGVANQWGLTDECQARRVQFLSVFFDEKPWIEALGRLSKFKRAMPGESAEWAAFEREDIPKVCCLSPPIRNPKAYSQYQEFYLPHARGVIAGPAGAIWPYKFVTGMLSRLRDKFPSDFRLETNTPVTDIHNSNGKYTVQTTRGTILARHVVHCTNAHVGHLVPGLRGRIYSIRGQMSAQTPGDKFPSQGGKHSWIFNYERGFDYLTQLPSTNGSSGQMMFGGAFAQSEGRGIADLGVATDSKLSLYIDMHLSGALSAVFGCDNWGAVSGPSVQSMWTGNMGFSADGLPWVGMLPSSLTGRKTSVFKSGCSSENQNAGGEWVSAAFSGEGMVQAWLCGKALAVMLLSKNGRLADGQSSDLSWLPEQMLVTEERARVSVLPRMVKDLERSMSNL